MPKKTIAAGGLLIATAAGALATCTPAFAQVAVAGYSQSHLFSDKTRNWNGSENENLNRIRLRVHNRNNNVAVARVPRSRTQRPVIVTNNEREPE